ncbi:STAS-like domain-containing protein [uncultured Capnocytophaga sp.]|uniref:STAS-like domain-containing protein n=1 Tax=uncultured Capnocytophaga sp. TaxID=159273 RepID=UPI0026287163|nr:STAS-like domain-containing protein [uncultured Capnocytophaga sp.]
METLAFIFKNDYTPKTTDETRLRLKNILQHDTAITYEDGEKVYALIFQALTEEKKVILDFQGITLVIPAFLHAAIGELYKDFDSDFLNNHLILKNIEGTNKVLLDMVIKYTKQYIADPEAFERAIKNTF